MLLADLGFEMIHPDPVGARGSGTDAHLLVALRDQPSLRHFDPESIAFYRPHGGGAELVTMSRVPAGSTEVHEVLWGHVHVVDRVPVENRFLTFGGELRVTGLDSALTIADLRSPAPIVRWGGHSQGTDALTQAIGAFFGRLIVPIDFTPGAAARIDAVSPMVLFTAFLSDAKARLVASARRYGEPSELDIWLAKAWARARQDPETCAAADKLLAEMPS